MITKDVEILKNPAKYSTEYVVDALNKFGSDAKIEGSFLNPSIMFCRNGYEMIILRQILFDYRSPHSYNKNQLLFNDMKKHFRHPLFPTKEESVLFEIEFGFSYPVNLDRTLIKLIKD